MVTIKEQKYRLYRLEELIKERQLLKEEIRKLSKEINALNSKIYKKQSPKYHKTNPYENNECFLMFGKHYYDLTDNEMKKYYILRQKKSREKRKGNNYSMIEIFNLFYKDKWEKQQNEH